MNELLNRQRLRLNTLLQNQANTDEIVQNSIASRFSRFRNKINSGTRSGQAIQYEISQLSPANVNRYFDNLFQTYINESVLSAERSSRRLTKRNRNAVKYPWFVVDLTGGRVSFEPLYVPGIAAPGGLWWQIGWRHVSGNPNAMYPFPTGYMEVGTSPATNYLKYQNVGRFCATETASNRPWCASSNYNLSNNGTDRNIVSITKNGVGSLSVKQLATLLIRTPTGARRRYFLDSKRNGDWGQVFTCYYLNENPNLGIIKPGSWQIAQQLFKDPVNVIGDLLENFNIVYTSTTFWSADRLACFLAYILGIPVVYQKGRLLYYGKRDFADPLPLTGDTVIDDLIINNFNTSANSKNYINSIRPGKPPNWLLYLAILDTAHDFGKKTKRTNLGVDPYAFKTKIIDLIEGIDSSNTTFTTNVKRLFTNISKKEDVVGDYLSRHLTPTSDASIQADLNQKQSCIIFDYGFVPPKLRPMMAILSAKYTDPTT